MNGEFIEEADVASKLGVDFDVRVQKANEREAKRVANEKLQAGMPTALELSARRPLWEIRIFASCLQ